jgi:hypothetical protein
MKQNIIILITLIFSILSCKINMHLNKFEGYKGEPKLVVTSDYSVLQKNDTLVEELNSTDSTFFDKQGRAIQHILNLNMIEWEIKCNINLIKMMVV